MTLIGRKITSRELNGRWVYADLGSKRHGDERLKTQRSRNLDLADLATQRINGLEFDDLSMAEKAKLASVENISVGRFSNPMLKFHTFVCLPWDKARVSNTFVVDTLDPRRLSSDAKQEFVPYLTFFGSPPAKKADGRCEETDPKYQADQIAVGGEIEAMGQDAALIVIPTSFGDLLIDGTFRSLLFMRSLDRFATIPVWYPMTDIA